MKTVHPALAFPLEGEWSVVDTVRKGHDGCDFVCVADCSNAALSWQHNLFVVAVSKYASWSSTVRAPLDGTVIAVENDEPDSMSTSLLAGFLQALPFALRIRRYEERHEAEVLGNSVVIEDEDYLAYLVHLRQGSVTVQRGQNVKAGAPIGEVGNSGCSLRPHLHLAVAKRGTYQPVAFSFDDIERDNGSSWVHEDHIVLKLHDRIRPSQ
jgi:hypothetical protein